VELVKRNLPKVEISGGINLDLKVKWCWCNQPYILLKDICTYTSRLQILPIPHT